jgi:hypothetical protein
MTLSLRGLARFGLLWGLVALAGCAPELSRVSEVESLRVLGVQKDHPYARPGETVTLSMLDFDGSKDAPRPIERIWVSGCFNPLGDSYFGCFAGLDQSGGTPTQEGSQVRIGTGTSFEVTLPEDIISSRPPPLDPRQPRYGMGIVFFAICAGHLAFDEDVEGLPVVCNDDDGKPLGPDDFVVGFSTIYAYDEVANSNPVVTGLELDGEEVAPDCIGADCLDAPEVPEDCDGATQCVDACPEDSTQGDCSELKIEPLIDPDSVEADDVAAEAYGRDLTEQMWISYYVSAGSLSSEVRLLNDASLGFNQDPGTKFRPPEESGPVHIWAVAHDSRGGADWLRVTVFVR